MTVIAHRTLQITATLVVLAGVFFRFWDLGGAPLAIDEYYFGTSMLNTLEHCVPAFPCGGYYTRGLLIQYLALPLLALGSTLEFAVRFWPAVASLISIAAVWQIARLAGGYAAASIAVVLTSLSLWEIEFARFGRMYAPFQAVFLWYIYFQIEHLVKGREYARWCYLALSAVAIFTYAGAAILLAFNFLAWIWREKRWTLAHMLVSGTLLVLGTRYYTIDFRRLGVPPEQLPPSASSEPAQGMSLNLPIDLPPLPGSAGPLFLLGIICIGTLLWRFRSNFKSPSPSALVWALAALSFCFGLLGFGLALSVAALLLGLPAPVHNVEFRPKAIVGWLTAFSVAWLVALVPAFFVQTRDFLEALKDALRYMLDYPDVYYKVALPWMRTIPATAVALGVLILPCLWAACRRIRTPPDTTRYLLGALILLVLLVAILRQPYAVTRYTYFLYPLVLVLASVGIVTVAESIGNRRLRAALSIVTVCALLVVAEDYRLLHLVRINEPEIRYRTAYDFDLAVHYYLRWDFRSTATYVNERHTPDDTVIVFEKPLPHYLNVTDGIFVRQGTNIHSLVWACNGTRDLWSNAPLLDTPDEVRNLIDEAQGDVWLIVRTAAYASRDPLEASLVEERGLTPEFVSQDGNLAVYRLENSRDPA